MKCAPKPQAASRPDPQYAKSPHLPQLAASRQNTEWVIIGNHELTKVVANNTSNENQKPKLQESKPFKAPSPLQWTRLHTSLS